MGARFAVAAGAFTVGLAALTGWAWSTTATSAVDPASGSSAGPVVDGAALFLAKGCATCHAGRDAPSVTGLAPSLVEAAAWAGSRRPGVSAEAYLLESIREPGAFVSPEFVPNGPLAAMPGIATSPAELEALVAYLLDGD